MRNIGQTLQERREELGYTLQSMSEKIRVPISKLKAIEEGDLKALENDIGYVKFYIRFYCNALHLDFEDFREELEKSMDEYSNTTKMLKMVELEEIQDRINSRTKSAIQTKKPNRGKFRKPDLSFISFVALISVLAISLILVFIFLVLPKLMAAEVEPDSDVVDVMPQPIVDTPVEDPTDEPVIIKELTIEKTGVDTYKLSGLSDQQELQMIINFKSNAYVKIMIDGVSPNNPASKRYNVGDTLTQLINVSEGMIVEVYIGWMNGNTITLNGLNVPLDETVASRNGSVTLIFKMEGIIVS